MGHKRLLAGPVNQGKGGTVASHHQTSSIRKPPDNTTHTGLGLEMLCIELSFLILFCCKIKYVDSKKQVECFNGIRNRQ